MLAGALQRRCYTRWGHETIYPNIYVVLIGGSGKCRKGTAMRIGRDIFMSTDLPLVSESITREALIRAMKNSYGSFRDGSDIKFHCSLMCMSDELSVFLGQKDVRFLADLTDWYDSRDEWKYETKGAGTDHIQGVCFNLLGASAPDWLQSILPQEAVGGGFTSRVIFVVEEKKEKIVPFYTLTEEEKELKKELIHDLQKVANISGEFKYEPAATEWYNDWYIKTEKDALKGDKPISDPRMAGYCDRRATHIRKLSMSMAASRSDERIVKVEDLERSLKVLQAVEINMHRTFGGLGKSQYSEVVELVLDYLLLRKEVSKSELLTKFYRDIDPQSLKIAEEVLTSMKVMKIERKIGDRDNDTIYRYTG